MAGALRAQPRMVWLRAAKERTMARPRPWEQPVTIRRRDLMG